MLWGHEMFPRAWGNLAHALKTGEVPFDHIFGRHFFEYLAEHEDVGEMFNMAMSARSRREHDAVLATYDFGSCKHIVDVGGGTGGLLTAICARYPSSEGVVFDLPFAQAGAEETFRAAGLDARCRFIAGNFFETTPPAGTWWCFPEFCTIGTTNAPSSSCETANAPWSPMVDCWS
jgi:hypothetical protein